MNAPIFIDLRNVYRRAELLRHGFAYHSVGRPEEDIEIELREPVYGT